MQIVNPFGLMAKIFIERPSYEQTLAAVANQVGSFIALSKPSGEAMQGAARLEAVSDKEWKNVVEEYLEKSQLVVMRAGETEGLIWEINRIFSKKLEQMIVLYLQFEGDQDAGIVHAKYKKFKNSLNRQLE